MYTTTRSFIHQCLFHQVSTLKGTLNVLILLIVPADAECGDTCSRIRMPIYHMFTYQPEFLESGVNQGLLITTYSGCSGCGDDT